MRDCRVEVTLLLRVVLVNIATEQVIWYPFLKDLDTLAQIVEIS